MSNFQTSRVFGRSGRLNDGNGTEVFACYTSDSRSYPFPNRSTAAFGLWDPAGGIRGPAFVSCDTRGREKLGYIADHSGAARDGRGLERFAIDVNRLPPVSVSPRRRPGSRCSDESHRDPGLRRGETGKNGSDRTQTVLGRCPLQQHPCRATGRLGHSVTGQHPGNLVNAGLR